MGNVNALLKSHCQTKLTTKFTSRERKRAQVSYFAACESVRRQVREYESGRGNPHQCMTANAHKVENGISAKVKCKAQGTHTQRQNRWEREGCMYVCVCVCDTQRERLEWKCRCNRALFVYVFLPLTHTHTHSLPLSPPAPLRAIMRRVCSCVRLPLPVPSSLSFTLFASFPVSVVFFLFSLIFSSVRACVCERRRQLCQRRCLRRVHKCKFTRTFEMCSHSGTKTFINALRRGRWAAQSSGKEVALGNEMMEYSGTIISVCLLYIYIISLYVQRLYIVLVPFAYYAWECMRNGNS